MKLSISNREVTGSVEYITGGNGKFTCAKHQEVTSSGMIAAQWTMSSILEGLRNGVSSVRR